MKKILDFIIKTMNGMAYGLFSTLIIGTILGTIGGFFKEDTLVYAILNLLSNLLTRLTGVGIGIGIAWSLKLDGLKLICASVSGAIAANFSNIKIWELFNLDNGVTYNSYFFEKLRSFAFNEKAFPGDPLSIYCVVILTILLMSVVLKKKTSVDIIIIPLFSLLTAFILSLLLCGPVSEITTIVGEFIRTTTDLHPFIMGIIIAVVMGMALTAPISSAAIAITFGISGRAGGAAVIGCCVQMIGFAVMSIRDNKIGTVISVAIGTSMLQFKNIVRKPIVWLPTIITSAILGPLGTCLFKTKCEAAGAGMGSSGLVGYINTLKSMGDNAWLSIILLMTILPIILVFGFDYLFRKLNLIKKDDLKI